MAICAALTACRCTSQGSCLSLTPTKTDASEFDDPHSSTAPFQARAPPTIPRYTATTMRCIAPSNFGTVQPGMFYRSGYPSPENFDFIASYLRVKTIITLVPEPISGDYEQFMLANHITHVQIHVPANKEGSVNITQETMDEVLSTMLAHNREPVLIHCNRGKHRTGCAVACFRKAQGRSNLEIMKEYNLFAAPKVRLDDVRFIEQFDAERFAPMIERQLWVNSPLSFVGVDLQDQQSMTPAVRAS